MITDIPDPVNRCHSCAVGMHSTAEHRVAQKKMIEGALILDVQGRFPDPC